MIYIYIYDISRHHAEKIKKLHIESYIAFLNYVKF